MKITRCYASPENAVNVNDLIKNLLAVEAENILNSLEVKTQNNSSPNNNIGGECS
ncbi:hypothetical protein [Jeotgalibacillus proteolyticus]|uniref:hypothetical protein n=1 Tax=Jeotgalibacillus proteolyticus TaxID=2082395 RepID=UPI003CF54150